MSSRGHGARSTAWYKMDLFDYGRAVLARHLPSYVAGIMTARQPVKPNDSSGPGGFNGRNEATLSLFLYNQDG